MSITNKEKESKEAEKGAESKEVKEEAVNSPEDGSVIRVNFKRTYIGALGKFYAGDSYKIPASSYEKLKADCVKEE
jgi:hypothetical protein